MGATVSTHVVARVRAATPERQALVGRFMDALEADSPLAGDGAAQAPDTGGVPMCPNMAGCFRAVLVGGQTRCGERGLACVVAAKAGLVPSEDRESGEGGKGRPGTPASPDFGISTPFATAVGAADVLAEMRQGFGALQLGLAEVRKEFREMRKGKECLAQMHGEGMFAFARHIDREAREEFLAIMAGGDVAKAARDLDMKDSTLRSQLAKWPKRGKAYAALAEIVRWRKSIRGQAGMEFAKRVASGAEWDVDFPALIRDVVAELEELAPEDWEERCGDLADTLRKVVS